MQFGSGEGQCGRLWLHTLDMAYVKCYSMSLDRGCDPDDAEVVQVEQRKVLMNNDNFFWTLPHDLWSSSCDLTPRFPEIR